MELDMKPQQQLIKLTCMVCREEFMDKEPSFCCSGRDCGCMGQPIEPIVCSKECYDKLLNKDKL